MAINWKHRAPVFRLLVAIYAELGEEGFKGRYGNIAKRYGPDATYDSIKSFFAKEIARAAQDLETQSPAYRVMPRTGPQRQSSKSVRRPLHLEFDDEDFSIVGEREVEGYQSHPLQAPAKRPRVSEPQLANVAEPRQSNEGKTPTPESFGYVTNEGSYRCALCFCQFNSQEALDTHERKSDLHLNNLKNVFQVCKGRAKLAEVTSIGDSPHHRPFQPAGISSELDGFDSRGVFSAKNDNMNGNMNEELSIIQGRRPTNEQPLRDSMSDTIEVLPVFPSPSTQQPVGNDGAVPILPISRKNGTVDKGKSRATPVPAIQVNSQRYSAAPANIQGRPQSQRPTNAQAERGTSTVSNTFNHVEPLSNGAQVFTPSERAAILRSTEIRLLDKCIENHPELMAQLKGCMEREFAAATSTTAVAAVAPASINIAPMFFVTGEAGSGEDWRARLEGADRYREGEAIFID